MSEKEYNQLMDLFERKIREKLTEEEALQSLIDAGIFDENGNYTEPYKSLETVTKKRR